MREGLYCRAVTRPPLLLLVAYRLFGWRLGPAYQAWTFGDITRRGYPLRQAAPVVVALAVVLAGALAVSDVDPARTIPLLLAAGVATFFPRRGLRERALRQQGLTIDGDAAAPWFADDAARRRRNVTAAVTSTALVLAALVLLARRGH